MPVWRLSGHVLCLATVFAGGNVLWQRVRTRARTSCCTGGRWDRRPSASSARRHENAQAPGGYRPFGHDYRPDLTRFVSEVFDLPATEQQLVAIERALEQRETLREQFFTD